MPVVLRGQKTEFIGVQVRIEITLFGAYRCIFSDNHMINFV